MSATRLAFRLLVVWLFLVASSTGAAAQESALIDADVLGRVSASPARLILPLRWNVPKDATYHPQATMGSPSRDTLANGTIIGALVGAVALGAIGGVICHLENAPGEGSCVTDVLRVAGIGAAIGAGAGAAVDAARSRYGGAILPVRIRF